MNPYTLTRNLWIALGGAVLVMAGTLFSWASIIGIGVNGVQTGDGKVMLALGALALVSVLLVPRRGTGKFIYSAGLFGLASLALSIYEIINLSSESVKFFGATIHPTVGFGLWLNLVASVGLLVGVVLHVRTSRSFSDSVLDTRGLPLRLDDPASTIG